MAVNFNKIRKNSRIVCGIVFGLYLLLLAYLVFFSPAFGRTSGVVREYNLIPFRTIRNYIKYRAYVNIDIFIINIIGNIVAFMPMGFFIPIMFRSKRSLIEVLFFSLVISFIIEIVQFQLVVGSFDVDDIILNTLGGIIGYLIFILIYYIYTFNLKRNRRRC